MPDRRMFLGGTILGHRRASTSCVAVRSWGALLMALVPKCRHRPRDILLNVARGWESKSVEQQQDEASFAPSQPKPRLAADELARLRRRQGLLLSRQHVLQQLQNASEPRYRQMLEGALADLDLRLAQLG